MTQVNRTLVDAVGDAFNANDIDTVMQYFAADAIFDHAAGPEPHGLRFTGAQTIRGVFNGLFEKVEKVHWQTLDCQIAGRKAYCEYLRTATYNDGRTEEFLSVDIITFKDGLIVHKDTYYKQRAN
ncbi:MAG: nuclear transport factor 2 family protein [Oceanospirillaceae bacterium]|jgi:ketosteroid isomerase-like protein|nr:nuclear transport factor 2 family protein [Oceanospirillaceae bacterium]